MALNRARKSITAVLLAGLSIALLTTRTYAQASAVAVVVNPKNPVSDLKLVDVRKMFAGEKRSWNGGAPIRLFVRAPGTHERAVLLKLLNISEGDYKQYWTAKVVRGEAQAEPVMLFSNGMQMEAVRLYQAAVALVEIGDVKPGVKVVRVEGHAPGEPGYPLN